MSKATQCAEHENVTHRQKVFVLGDDTQSFLAVVRSFGRRSFEVHAAPFNYRAPALASRYIETVHRLPRYVGSGEAWCEAVAALLERERFAYVVPVDDRNILCFQRFRERLCGLSKIALPTDEAIESFYDKLRTRELAARCNVPIPDGRLLRDDDSAETIAAEFALPVAVKPRRSYTLESLHHRGKVELIDTEARLAAVLDRIERRGDYLVESFFEGRGIGVSLLLADGRIVYGFEHHRLREVPGGGSSLRVSAPLDPARRAACQRMLVEAPYTGVAMFEFREDPATGRWVLLEVNARFWGSLPLPLGLGMDFPHDLFLLLCAGDVGPRTYRSGIYGRNLVADVYARTQRLPPGAGLSRKAVAALGEILPALPRMIGGRERSDTFVRDDPSPGIVEVGRLARTALAKLVRPVVTGLPGAAALRRKRVRAALARCHIDRPIVFLCQGNICRSPFAQHLLEENWNKGLTKWSITSAGLVPAPGRHCPSEAVQAARRYGIDLTGHVSRLFDESALAQAGVVFVFDRATLEDFRDRFPAARVPVFSLGDVLNGRSPADIEDPVGRDVEFFAGTYARVEQAIGELALLMRASCG